MDRLRAPGLAREVRYAEAELGCLNWFAFRKAHMTDDRLTGKRQMMKARYLLPL